MKAKEYYEKYNDAILALPEGVQRGEKLIELFRDFENEQREILTKRKAQRGEAVVAVIREQNQKWNALVHIFEQNNEGHSPIKRDGIKHVWERRIPELKEFL